MVNLEQGEGMIRLIIFVGVFVIMVLAETFAPRKQRALPRTQRWFTNVSLVIIDSVAVRVFIPILAISAADFATQNSWGLLSLIAAPVWVKAVIAIVLLDLLIYLQHIASHKLPILWRFHKVHHVDRDIDVTTGARFHPIEILLSMAFKLLCIIALGAPAIAVFVFEVILNASAMFNHSNVKLPLPLDRIIRQFIVTPDMHRVHHSIQQHETDSNYGFFLAVWDRLFKTYIAQPQAGHNNMVIGLAEYQSNKPASLIWSLLLPFNDLFNKAQKAKVK